MLVVALVAGVLSTLAGAGTAAAAVDYDCSDFSTQAQAQQVYVNAGGPRSDPYRLDADDDGRACDSLPCPCGTAGGSTSGTTGTSGGKATARLVQYGRVTRVVDGDTIDVRLHSGADRRVRLIGIDTPEVYGGNPFERVASYRRAQREAQAAPRGIWKAC